MTTQFTAFLELATELPDAQIPVAKNMGTA